MINGSFEDINRIFNYKYKCADKSIMGPWVRAKFCRRLLGVIPPGLAPNLVSVMGHVSSAAAFWFVSCFQVIQGFPPSGFFLLIPACCIFIYLVFDNTDGMQARRAGVSNALGDFIDHWLDGCSACTIPLGLAICLKLSPSQSIGIASLSCLAFWSTHWQRRRTGILTLPQLGEVEGNLFAIFLYLVLAAAGTKIWELRVIFGATIKDIAAVIVMFAFLHAAVPPPQLRKQILSDLFGVLVGILPILICFIEGIANSERSKWAIPISLLIGGLLVKHTGDVLRNYLIGTQFEKTNVPLLVALALVIFTRSVFNCEFLNIVSFAILATLVSFQLIYQFWHTAACAREQLKIRIFKI